MFFKCKHISLMFVVSHVSNAQLVCRLTLFSAPNSATKDNPSVNVAAACYSETKQQQLIPNTCHTQLTPVMCRLVIYVQLIVEYTTWYISFGSSLKVNNNIEKTI